MRTIRIFFLVPIILISAISIVLSAEIPEEMIKNAYKQLLAGTDKNKDGKISMAECESMFTDKTKAEESCGFWDANHDGIITEEEYVQQVHGIQNR